METSRSLETVEGLDHESQAVIELKRPKTSPETGGKTTVSRRGANNPMYGRTHSDETKAKMSASKLGSKHSAETKARISASKLGANNAMYGQKRSDEIKAKIRQGRVGKKHSEESKAKVRAAVTREKNPCWDKNIIAVQEAISLYANGMSMKQASLQLGFSGSWLAGWKQRHPLRFKGYYEGLMAIGESELSQARSVYEKLDYGEDNKELLALYYGFGVYRRHSCHQIGVLCGKDQTWVMQRLEQIMAGQRLPVYGLCFEITTDSRRPYFQIESRFSIYQLHRLADILPKLDRLEVEMAIGLFSLGGRPPETVAEMNARLFQSASWGEQKIKNTKRLLENYMINARFPYLRANSGI